MTMPPITPKLAKDKATMEMVRRLFDLAFDYYLRVPIDEKHNYTLEEETQGAFYENFEAPDELGMNVESVLIAALTGIMRTHQHHLDSS